MRPLLNSAREQLWDAASLLDGLDDLGIRTAARCRRELS